MAPIDALEIRDGMASFARDLLALAWGMPKAYPADNWDGASVDALAKVQGWARGQCRTVKVGA